MVHLLDLPFEVLTHIASFSLGSRKHVRLTSSRLSQASTPALFRSVTLVPHRTSFENLLALSRSPLSHHVHDVVYDVRLLCSIPDIKMAFEANEFRLVGQNMDASRRMIFTLLDDYEKQALNSIESTEVKLKHMLQILPCLPNLERITITSGNLCELPHLYRQLKESLFIESDFYFETSNHSGHEARSVLLCLGALSLNIPSLTFIGIDWSEIVLYNELRTPARYLTMLQRVFRALPKEQVSLSMFLFLYTDEQRDRGAAIEDLMPVCATVLHNVQHLTLSLATTRSERQLFMPTGPSSPLSTATRCAWLHWVVSCLQSLGQVGPRSLKSLRLSSLVLEPADLDFMLSGCRDSLTKLRIGDLRLYTASDQQASDAYVAVEESCWVSSLETIPKHSQHLQTVNLFGRFYNGASQDWLVSPGKGRNLRWEVEGWLLCGGVCPLESERIEGGFQGTRAGDASFKIFRRTLEDGADDEVYYDFPPTSENELLGA
jgi:hypothetical protein